MMTPEKSDAFEVVIAGGGVAALEAMLALRALAGDRVGITLVAPNAEFHYRPLVVREPFTSAPTSGYKLSEIADRAAAHLVVDRFRWLDPSGRNLHTSHGLTLPYDAALLAMGARAHPRFRDALTLDESRLGEQLAEFVEALDRGLVSSVALVVPSLPIWSLPAYELALMTANRAAAQGREVTVLLITPEDAPLAALGVNASAEVGRLLSEAGVTTITSANSQIREPGKIDLYPLRRSFSVDRIIALPELYAPAVPGVPTSAERGFVTVDQYGAVEGLERVYAAGDLIDSAVKHAGLSADQADVVAGAIAALAGAPLEPRPLRPALHVLLLGAAEPMFIRSETVGEHSTDVEIGKDPLWEQAERLHTDYLGPCLAELDAGSTQTLPGGLPQ